jgi:KUP system potassium uptake protein
MITPAISVLSAVEGLEVVTKDLAEFVIPLTIMFLLLLFYFQKYGTAKIGVFFGPVILLWFLSIAATGVRGIVKDPQVLYALNPWYAIHFFLTNQMAAFFVLGSVVLAVTGGEALYADMGHVGKTPIRKAWFSVVFPCLVLNYFGQGAILLKNPEAIKNPFFLLAPNWALFPLVVVATAAAIIASQALISGIFSISKQAMQLGYFPRMHIVHTSKEEIGQIYLPFMNGAMLVGVLFLVLQFKTSTALASAYGIAVTGTMAITTVLAYIVAREKWRWSLARCILIFGSFMIVEFTFFATNIIKFFSGGWVAILVAVIVFVTMTTWRYGRKNLLHVLKSRSISIDDFLKKLEMTCPQRVSGYAIYMSGDPWGIPFPLLHNLKHNKVLHNEIMLLTVQTRQVPMVRQSERVQIEEIGKDFYRVIAYFGFMERPNIYLILKACQEKGLHFPMEYVTFVLGRETIVTKDKPIFAAIRKKIFAFMSRNAERPMNFFGIPVNQVIEVGVQIEI